MITIINNKLAMLMLIFFCALSGTGIAANLPGEPESFLALFSLDEIKKIVGKNEKLMLKAFPEDTAVGWYGIAEDPVSFFQNSCPLKSYDMLCQKIYQDVHARKIIPLEQLWLRNHRFLHTLILGTALKAALLKEQPDEAQVKKWVADYIAFFFEPLLLEPTAECRWSRYDVRRYSYLSDRCPQWLEAHLQEFSQNVQGQYPQLYLRMENARKRLEVSLLEDHISQEANSLISIREHIFLQDLAQDLAKAHSNTLSKLDVKYFSNCILNELAYYFPVADLQEGHIIIIDNSLGLQIKKDKDLLFVKVEGKYTFNRLWFKKIVNGWALDQAPNL